MKIYLGIGVNAEINGENLQIETRGGAGSDELHCVAIRGRGFYTGKTFTVKPYTFFWVSVYRSGHSENILINWNGKSATQVVETFELQFFNDGASLPLHPYSSAFSSGEDYLEALTRLELQAVTIEAQIYTALNRVIGEKAPFWFQHWFADPFTAAQHKTINDMLDWFWWAHFETGNYGLAFSEQGMPVPSEESIIEDQAMLDWLLQVEQDIEGDVLKLSYDKSKLISDLLIVAEANLEEVFFKDAFNDAVGDDSAHPCYWLSLAIEACSQAAQRGADIEAIKAALIETGRDLLLDITPENFE